AGAVVGVVRVGVGAPVVVVGAVAILGVEAGKGPEAETGVKAADVAAVETPGMSPAEMALCPGGRGRPQHRCPGKGRQAPGAEHFPKHGCTSAVEWDAQAIKHA